jgi:two-component system chemotaxis response regulator CheB
MGASTGGTRAIEALLTRLPADGPPILIVQHMPPHFTRVFAQRLDSVCSMNVVEADDGQRLQRGTAYIARGDFHLQVVSQGGVLQTALNDGPPIHYQRPAVDALYTSVAQLRGVPTVALLLTGMGSDGAAGMVALREAGAVTIAESEQSCVVFGMPAEAIARGGATHVASLLSMPNLIAESFKKRPAARAVSRTA